MWENIPLAVVVDSQNYWKWIGTYLKFTLKMISFIYALEVAVSRKCYSQSMNVLLSRNV